MNQPKIRWGIVGTGYAKEFAKAIAVLPDAEVVAVTSRYQESADAFGQEFNVPHCYDDVAKLARDPNVDVVYVCSAPMFHAEHALELLSQGKAVLVEKPFTINAAEAKAVYAMAREKGVFCMEALWSRFLPATQQVAAWLAEDKSAKCARSSRTSVSAPTGIPANATLRWNAAAAVCSMWGVIRSRSRRWHWA